MHRRGSCVQHPCLCAVVSACSCAPVPVYPLRAAQLHQFELAVGMTNCTHEQEHTYTIMSANSTNSSAGSNLTLGSSTVNSTLSNSLRHNSTAEGDEEEEEDKETGFEVPEFQPGMYTPTCFCTDAGKGRPAWCLHAASCGQWAANGCCSWWAMLCVSTVHTLEAVVLVCCKHTLSRVLLLLQMLLTGFVAGSWLARITEKCRTGKRMWAVCTCCIGQAATGW